MLHVMDLPSLSALFQLIVVNLVPATLTGVPRAWSRVERHASATYSFYCNHLLTKENDRRRSSISSIQCLRNACAKQSGVATAVLVALCERGMRDSM
jgi:hypothetical protein